MISEAQQEQASLYALGLLDADEADAFERQLAAAPELGLLADELRETAARLALAPAGLPAPPAALKARLLDAVQPKVLPSPTRAARPAFSFQPMVPWALAALLLGCTAFLAVERGGLQRELSRLRQAADASGASGDMFARVAFCELEPTPDATARPRAAVLWDASRRQGVLRLSQFPPPAVGHDYQLWVVETSRKEPVDAGLVHVNSQGQADLRFEPAVIPAGDKVAAVAISLEAAGGSPTNKGPILYLGKF